MWTVSEVIQLPDIAIQREKYYEFYEIPPPILGRGGQPELGRGLCGFRPLKYVGDMGGVAKELGVWAQPATGLKIRGRSHNLKNSKLFSRGLNVER